MNAYILDYLSYMRGKNSSENTIRSYSTDLTAFKRWFKGAGYVNVNDLKLRDLRAFISSLNLTSAKTIARKTASVKSFFKWLHSQEIIEINPAVGLENPTLEKKELDLLSDYDIELMFDYVEIEKETKRIAYRDCAILKLLFNAGVRRAELANIKISDINFTTNSILINGKGRKQRHVYISDEVKKVVGDYMIYRSEYKYANDTDTLFISQVSPFMNLGSINNVVNKYMELAHCKKKGRSVHTARKSCATHMYNATGDIYAVAKALGHESVNTTMLYAEAHQDRIRNAFMSVAL